VEHIVTIRLQFPIESKGYSETGSEKKCAQRDITTYANLNLLRVRQLLPQLVERMLVNRQHFGARAFGLDLRVQLLDLLLVLLEHARVGASRLVDLWVFFGAARKANPKGRMMM
jgi:hypothetical protein